MFHDVNMNLGCKTWANCIPKQTSNVPTLRTWPFLKTLPMNLPSVTSQGSYGPLLQVDLMHRPVQEKTIIDVLKGVMPGMDIFAYRLDNEIKIEWLECCVSATATGLNLT